MREHFVNGFKNSRKAISMWKLGASWIYVQVRRLKVGGFTKWKFLWNTTRTCTFIEGSFTQKAVSHHIKCLRIGSFSAVWIETKKCGSVLEWKCWKENVFCNVYWPAMKTLADHASRSTAKPNIYGLKLIVCIWWDQLGVVHYELYGRMPIKLLQGLSTEYN